MSIRNVKQEFKDRFDANLVLKLNREQGLTLKQISNIVNIPERRLGELCTYYDLNIVRQRSHIVVDNFFHDIDSEIKAYLLGYFIADGCVRKEPKKRNGKTYSYSYRFSILNSIDDLEITKLFQKYITPNTKIVYRNDQTGVKYHRKEQCLLRWSSKEMYDDLISIGITPNKTLNANFQLPESIVNSKYFRHLIRGLIDGDGHIGKYSIQLCLNSDKFAEQIINYFKRFEHLSSYKLKKYKGKTCCWWILHLNSKYFIQEYYDIVYKDANYYLKRKYHNTEINSKITKGLESL